MTTKIVSGVKIQSFTEYHQVHKAFPKRKGLLLVEYVFPRKLIVALGAHYFTQRLIDMASTSDRLQRPITHLYVLEGDTHFRVFAAAV